MTRFQERDEGRPSVRVSVRHSVRFRKQVRTTLG